MRPTRGPAHRVVIIRRWWEWPAWTFALLKFSERFGHRIVYLKRPVFLYELIVVFVVIAAVVIFDHWRWLRLCDQDPSILRDA